MDAENTIICQTKKWIETVVIACNFCPFAAKPFGMGTIRYVVETKNGLEAALSVLIRECIFLDEDTATETTLIIFPEQYNKFDDYLDLVSLAEKLMKKEGYEGIFQVASFHPEYLFGGTAETDPANYTNRSPYPMLHILRESSIEKALDKYPDPETIPDRNILFAREKGLEFMKNLRKGSF